MSEFLSSLYRSGAASRGPSARLAPSAGATRQTGHGHRGLASKKIDELDRQLVRLLNERAQCAHEIGKLKRNSAMPVYEPDREKIIFENIARDNKGPLSRHRSCARSTSASST